MKCKVEGCDGEIDFNQPVIGFRKEVLFPCKKCGVLHWCEKISVYGDGKHYVNLGQSIVEIKIAAIILD